MQVSESALEHGTFLLQSLQETSGAGSLTRLGTDLLSTNYIPLVVVALE